MLINFIVYFYVDIALIAFTFTSFGFCLVCQGRCDCGFRGDAGLSVALFSILLQCHPDGVGGDAFDVCGVHGHGCWRNFLF